MDRLRNVAHERNRWAPAPLHSPQNNSSHIVYKKRFLQIKRQPWLSVWFWVFREWSRWYLGKTKMWSRPPDLRKYGIWLRTCREWKIAHLRRKLVDVLRLKHTWVKWSDYFGVGELYLDICLIDFLIGESSGHANTFNITGNKEEMRLVLVQCSKPWFEKKLVDLYLSSSL
jgi:hypothetical protein